MVKRIVKRQSSDCARCRREGVHSALAMQYKRENPMDYDTSDEKKMESGGEEPQNPWESADFQKFLKYREEKAEDLRILDAWRREKKPRLHLPRSDKGTE